MFNEDEYKKEFVCRNCGKFLNPSYLKDGKCPVCDSDENVFQNDLNDEEEQ
jgi:rubrerythrin